MKFILKFLCIFLIFVNPIHNTVLKISQNKAIQNMRIHKQDRQLKQHHRSRKTFDTSEHSEIVLQIIFILLLFFVSLTQPKWALLFFAIPLLYKYNVFGNHRKLSLNKQTKVQKLFQSTIKRKLSSKDLTQYEKAKKIYKSYMKNYYAKSHEKLNERKLIELGKDVVKKFNKKFQNKNFDKIIEYTSHQIFLNKNKIKKTVVND